MHVSHPTSPTVRCEGFTSTSVLVFGLQPHLYADDSQIYGSCRPSGQCHRRSTESCLLTALSLSPTGCGPTDANWTLRRQSSYGAHKSSASSTYRPTCCQHLPPASFVRDLGIYINADLSVWSVDTRREDGRKVFCRPSPNPQHQ